MQPKPLTGLYAITDSKLAADSGATLADQVGQALEGGAAIIQYRDKGSDQQQRIAEAGALLQLCRGHAVPLIINDDLSLAAEIGADGVHLGRDDADIHQARSALGEDAIIGISCYNRLELALGAQESGADYVAFGRFFSSTTKPQAQPADLELLHRARPKLQIPIVAIGGITPENGAPLIEAGADMLAVIHGIFGQQDIAAACCRFNTLFKQ
jgi:thiamine-phosphate pyrophosphorylase